MSEGGEDTPFVVTNTSETSSLLKPQSSKIGYITFPENSCDENWTAPVGFWWIEIGKLAYESDASPLQ
jgi:hypothetical protein